MSPGSHAAADGSFRRSAGIQVGRAVFIIVVAVVVGVVLLRHNGGSSHNGAAPPATTTSTTRAATSTTVAASSTTSTTVAPTTVPPSQVKVVVANGTTTSGAAGFFRGKLQTAGWNTSLAAIDATSTHVATSAVYYQAGYKPEATAVATALGLPASSVAAFSAQAPVPSYANAANVIVVVGANLSSQVG